MDRSDLKVIIINGSKHKLYVDQLSYGADSRIIMADVREYCSHGADTIMYPRIINPSDSAIMMTKFLSDESDKTVKKRWGKERIFSINADSLDDYCNKGYKYNILGKQWVRIYANEKIDPKKKTCRFVVR